MTCIELVKINSKCMELMSKYGIMVSDYKFVGLYDEYLRMKAAGEKYWYIITHLSEEHGISESSVKRVVRRFSKEVRM